MLYIAKKTFYAISHDQTQSAPSMYDVTLYDVIIDIAFSFAFLLFMPQNAVDIF